MRNILVIKDADFSAYAVEKINLYAPAPLFHIAVGGTVTIIASGADHIYYTTNGDEPTNNSAEYAAPFSVSAGAMVKAVAEYSSSGLSDVSSVMFNAGGADILYKTNYTLGYPSSSSTTLTEISLTGYGISDYIPVNPYSDLNINYGANVQTMGMWSDYYKFKIVEYDEDKNVVVSTEARENVFGTNIPVGNNCIWSIRDGNNNISYKNTPIQRATRYIKIVVKLDTSANVVDKDNDDNVLFQYIPS